MVSKGIMHDLRYNGGYDFDPYVSDRHERWDATGSKRVTWSSLKRICCVLDMVDNYGR